MLHNATTFTGENVKIQAIESKHVINRELRLALQFPIGDDVSALNPLQSSVRFFKHQLYPDGRGQYAHPYVPRTVGGEAQATATENWLEPPPVSLLGFVKQLAVYNAKLGAERILRRLAELLHSLHRAGLRGATAFTCHQQLGTELADKPGLRESVTSKNVQGFR